MQPFRHTPYASARSPFSIGLEPLDPADWIDVDGDLARFLAEKRRLFADPAACVFLAHPDTAAAQQETLDLLADYLPARYPALYRRGAGDIEVRCTGERIRLGATDDEPPLQRAARLVQDDLVIMRSGPAGYELVAGAVCFPSSWRLEDKFGLPLDRIHRPVPGYGGKMARRMDLIFDRLPRNRIVWRTNWSIYDSDRLPAFRDGNALFSGGGEVDFDAAFLRVERQTLRRLPQSGDLLFTIRIHIDPLARLRDHPDRDRLARGLLAQIEALDPDQLAYKSLTRQRARLMAYLGEIAGPQDAAEAPPPAAASTGRR